MEEYSVTIMYSSIVLRGICVNNGLTMKETHRYTREQLVTGTHDAYDVFSTKDSSRDRTFLEYWTNGTTTHLMTVPAFAETNHTASKLKATTTSAAAKVKANTVRNSILAGSLSGIASTVVVYPFDVLRTKMQASAQLSSRDLRGPLHVFSQTWNHGGFRALYTGVSLPLAAQAVYKATVFSANQLCQSVVLDNRTLHDQKMGIVHPQHSLTMADHFLCGFIGGAINAAAFVTPVEFVRNQLIIQHTKLASGQVSTSPMSGPLDVVRSTIATHGISGLWRGLGTTVARDSLGCGCFFVSLAYCRQLLTDRGELPEFGVTILSGMFAGLGFWAVALPLDTVKTWVQDGGTLSTRDVMSESIARHGWLGTSRRLCRGWQMAFGRGAPSAAITICTYEFFYRKLETI